MIPSQMRVAIGELVPGRQLLARQILGNLIATTLSAASDLTSTFPLGLSYHFQRNQVMDSCWIHFSVRFMRIRDINLNNDQIMCL
jgi:hypothetical protein